MSPCTQSELLDKYSILLIKSSRLSHTHLGDRSTGLNPCTPFYNSLPLFSVQYTEERKGIMKRTVAGRSRRLHPIFFLQIYRIVFNKNSWNPICILLANVIFKIKSFKNCERIILRNPSKFFSLNFSVKKNVSMFNYKISYNHKHNFQSLKTGFTLQDRSLPVQHSSTG